MESKKQHDRRFEIKSNSFITIQDLNKAKENRYLTLRKQKRNNAIYSEMKHKLNFLHDKHYQINLIKLKTNNDAIRNFIIDLNKPQFSMNNLKYLLNSPNDDEVKFGIYAVRIFFQERLREQCMQENDNNQLKHNGINHGAFPLNNFQIIQNDKDQTQIHKIDKSKLNNQIINSNILGMFFDNNIINLLFNIIKKSQVKNEISDQINIFECVWIFLNMCAMYIEDETLINKIYSHFLDDDNFCSLIDLIDSSKFPLEIIFNVLCFFINLIINYPETKQFLVQTSLTSVLFKYLQTDKFLNTEITKKIFIVLHELYYDFKHNLSAEAYIILFKIFSLSLINFKSQDMIKYCLDILEMLSNKDIPEVIEGFTDYNLLTTLNNIIFERPLLNNEIFINMIIEIFYNLILKDNDKIRKEIIDPGHLLSFYNNIIIKSKKEAFKFDLKIEENLILCINNLIFFNPDKSLEYIFGEGIEIKNFLSDSSNSAEPKIKKLGIKSYINILYGNKIYFNFDFFISIVEALEKVYINDYQNCYDESINCLYIVILTCRNQQSNINELRNLLISKGFKEYLEKIKIHVMNNSNNNGNENKSEDVYEEIMRFLDETD